MELYENPAYYEIALSFFDVKKQVDTFKLMIKEFGKIKVKRLGARARTPHLEGNPNLS